MKVGIAGAGAIAMGYAAFLLKSGHEPSIWSPSGQIAPGTVFTVTGAIESSFEIEICEGAAALAQNPVIVLALPAYGHRQVLDALLPHLEPRHCVIFSGHLSFAALYLSKKLAERGFQIPIAVWNTTVLTSKAPSRTEIRVGAIRGKVDMAAVPARFGDQALKICSELFGDRFTLKDDMLTITLSNVNPQSHLGIALCNLTRMERGESWGQNTNITPAVGRLLEALDRERIEVAKALGKTVRTIFEHQALSFGASGGSVSEMALAKAAEGQDPPGPKTIDSRYVLEDAPFGLVPTAFLARLSGADIPLHKSGIEILNACYGRDFAADNDLLPELGITDTESLKLLAVEGYRPAA